MDHSHRDEEGGDGLQRSKTQIEELFLNGRSGLPFSGMKGRKGEKLQNTGRCTQVWGIHACRVFFSIAL